jgi:hypothetical protein
MMCKIHSPLTKAFHQLWNLFPSHKMNQNSAGSSCIQASLAKTSVSLQVVSPLSCQHIRATQFEHSHGTKYAPEMGKNMDRNHCGEDCPTAQNGESQFSRK